MYKIDSLVSELASSNSKHFTGLAVGVVINKQQTYAKGFGYTNRKSQVVCTDTSMMEVASISKAIVGIAIAKAIELGYCNLDSPVNTLLPFAIVNIHAPLQQITLRQIVTHTSGIHDAPRFFWNTFQYTDYKDPDISLADFVYAFVNPAGRYYGKHNFHKPAATGYPVDYSNLNAAIGALLVAHVSKMSFTDFTQQFIFDKAGMAQTGWLFSQLKNKTLSQKYTTSGFTLRHYTIRSYPSSTLYTSVTDMNKLFCALTAMPADSNRIFNNKTALLVLFDDAQQQFDYGIFWKRYGNHYGCTGINLGIEAVARFNPVSQQGYTIIFNQSLKKKQKQLYTQLLNYLNAVTQ